MKLTEEKRYWNFRLQLFLAEMRLNVLGMAITQPCQILINNYSLDQCFLHGTIRTQKIIEVMMLIITTGESVKFIRSKYIQESLRNTTPTRPDYFLFLQQSQAIVLINQSTHLFQNKNKRPRCIKVGNGPLKYLLCKKYCYYLLTTTQSDRFASCENFVSLSQTSSIRPWNKPILDIPKSERSSVCRIPTENGPWIPNWRSSSTAYRPLILMDVAWLSLFFLLFVLGLVVSERRVPSLSFPGGIFTRQVAPASVQGRRILRLVLVMGANTADYDIRCLLNNIHYPLPWLHVGLSTASSSRFSKNFPQISQKTAKNNYQKLLFVTKVAQTLLKKQKRFKVWC